MDHTPALTISVFARRVGLAPSALRFYDDCDLLKPAHVDEATGYRYYSPAQEQRARLLRDLRTAGLPLAEAGVVLDGPPEQARAVLETHQRRIRQETEDANAAVDRALRRLAGTTAQVSGIVLASAIRQVLPSALDGVLWELAEGELRLVATDRYRLAMRVLRPETSSGHGSLLMPVAETAEVGRWAGRLPEVTIDFDHRRIDARELSTMDEQFPCYREMLAGLAPPAHRIVVDRAALREALGTEPVLLGVGQDEIAVNGQKIPALCDETPLIVGFDPATLGPALDTSVGPDVLIELVDALRPAVIRSADQGSFTTLVMPQRSL
jgi:DNA-binding transcriptional MerR regulator